MTQLAINPTDITYTALMRAYAHFNKELFEDRLPPCLVTLQRKGGARGYFSRERFATRDGSSVTDEIALNPDVFIRRTVEEILSTLVHEMVHLEHFHFGFPSRSGYHNKAWSQLMIRVGLIPSDTGEPGGRQTGQRVTHYIEAGGRFEKSCASLLATGFEFPFVDASTNAKEKQAKLGSKTKFTCPTCGQNVWGKPTAHIVCGDDGALMVA